MNIILIGMRGSGKSTVGKLLASKLNWQFIETDDLVVKKAGGSIPEIVKTCGWEAFRNLELAVVKGLENVNNCVIAAGGGVVVYGENIKSLKKNGFIIWLKARPETLIARVGDDPNRPSLTGKPLVEDIKITNKKRQELYRQGAEKVFKVDSQLPVETCREILRLFNNLTL